MELCIKTLTGASLKLIVSPFENIYEVKFRIQRLEGIPMSQQHLIWQSEELQDERTLRDYHIQNGATLQLVLGMRGGPVNTRRVPSEEPSLQDVAEYLSDTRADMMSPSGCHPVTYIVCHYGDNVNLFVVDRDASSALSYSLGGMSDLCGDVSPLPGERREENDRTRQKMQLVRSQMQNLSLMKQRKAKVSRKGQPGRPPSSRSTSRQKLYRLMNTTPTAASSLNKNTLLPPIGCSTVHTDVQSVATPTAHSAAMSVSSPVAMAACLSDTPALLDACSPAAASGSVSLSPSPADDALSVTPTATSCTRRLTNSDSPVKNEHGLVTVVPAEPSSGADAAQKTTTVKSIQQEAMSDTHVAPIQRHSPLQGATNRLTPTVTSRAASKSSKQRKQSTSTITASTDKDRKPVTPYPTVGVSDLLDMPLPMPSSARLRMLESAYQQSNSSKPQPKEASQRKQENVAQGRESMNSAGERTRSNASSLVDWWSSELMPTTALGMSPSPTRFYRGPSGSRANSRTAMMLQGLNAYEMRTMSGMLNSLVRNQSRPAVAGSSLATSSPAPGSSSGNNGDLHLSTAERVRLPSARNPLRKLSAGRSRGASGFRLPSVKVAVRKKSAKKCKLCGARTRLATGFQCRCGNNFCSVHRCAEAHACTYDYKSEGRKLLEQSNPVVAAPKLPKI